MEFGLRIGLHGIRKPSGGWIRPATKPSGGKVRRVGGLRVLAHRAGTHGDGRVGGPGSLSVERFEGSPPSGGRPSGSGCRLTERPRAGKPSGETVRRGARPSGYAFQRAGTRGDGTVHRVELLSSRRFDGMGVFGSPDQRTERLKTDRSRRRQEGSSEHAARTPRPGTWRLHLFQHPIS